MTLRDVNSELIMDTLLHKRLKYRGLQIDIFIFDEGVHPKLKDLVNWFYNQLIYRPWTGRKMKYFRWAANFNHRVFDCIILPFLRIFKFNNRIDIGYGCIFHRATDKSTVFPLSKIEFEGKEFSCPHDVDTFLSETYGDWQNIPDEKERAQHPYNDMIIK